MMATMDMGDLIPMQEGVEQVRKELVSDAGAELPTWGRFSSPCQQLAIQVHHLRRRGN